MVRITHLRLTAIAVVLVAVLPALFFAATAERFSWRAYADPYDPFSPETSRVPPVTDPRFPFAEPPLFEPEPVVPAALFLGRPAAIDQMLFMLLGRDLFERLLRGGVRLTPEQAGEFRDGVVASIFGARIENTLEPEDAQAIEEGRLSLDLLERIAAAGAEQMALAQAEAEESGIAFGFVFKVTTGTVVIAEAMTPQQRVVFDALLKNPATEQQSFVAGMIALALRSALGTGPGAPR